MFRRITGLWLAVLLTAAADLQFHAISHLGGTGNSVQGAVIQEDGTIILAANLSSAAMAGSEGGGVLLWLGGNGTELIRAKRVAAEIRDLSSDAAGSLYVAAGSEGALKLAATGEAIWNKDLGGLCGRIDATGDGYCVALRHDRDEDSTPGSGEIHVFDPAGEALGRFKGHRHTLDICIDGASQTVIQIGWRQDRIHDGKRMEPVQVAYVRGMSYSGVEKYLLYDWAKDPEAPEFLNRPANNMADTRGYRCAIDTEGKLICGFESAGGNHIFRYEPKLHAGEWAPVKDKKAKGDAYHSFHNSKSEHKTVVTRHDPGTGEVLAVQEFTARLENGRANALRLKAGAIAGGPGGALLLGGASASGLPITHFPGHGGDYEGGSFVAALKPDLSGRIFTTRIQSGGNTHTVAAREVKGRWLIVAGGQTDKDPEKPFPALRSLQTEGKGSAGFFAVMEVK